jgi:hypothetical protein
MIPVVVAVMPPGDARLQLAQLLCMASLERCCLEVIEVPGDPRPRFGDLLRAARTHAEEWLAWINSDCQLLLPLSAMDCSAIDVLGMRRVEVGPGTICGGVDGYLIRSTFWDAVLSRDVPELWTGGTHVDWWLTRAAQKYGRYAESVCLAHLPHDRTLTSQGIDESGRENIANYEAWADRHGVSKC